MTGQQLPYDREPMPDDPLRQTFDQAFAQLEAVDESDRMALAEDTWDDQKRTAMRGALEVVAGMPRFAVESRRKSLTDDDVARNRLIVVSELYDARPDLMSKIASPEAADLLIDVWYNYRGQVDTLRQIATAASDAYSTLFAGGDDTEAAFRAVVEEKLAPIFFTAGQRTKNTMPVFVARLFTAEDGQDMLSTRRAALKDLIQSASAAARRANEFRGYAYTNLEAL